MKRIRQTLIEITKEINDDTIKDTKCELCGLQTHYGGECKHCIDIMNRIRKEQYEKEKRIYSKFKD